MNHDDSPRRRVSDSGRLKLDLSPAAPHTALLSCISNASRCSSSPETAPLTPRTNILGAAIQACRFGDWSERIFDILGAVRGMNVMSCFFRADELGNS